MKIIVVNTVKFIIDCIVIIRRLLNFRCLRCGVYSRAVLIANFVTTTVYLWFNNIFA